MEIRNLARNLAFVAILLGAALPLRAAQDVPVPGRCTPQVNQKLSEVITAGSSGAVDNVMVCGTTVGSSRPLRGRHGGQELLPLRVTLPDGSQRLVEVITDDDLDGVVTARPHATVFAFGQAFIPDHGHSAAAIHDVHCSTHRTAENGWVVVDGQRHPGSCHL